MPPPTSPRLVIPRLLRAALLPCWFGLLALALSGCAWSQEDRDFYGRGWLNPRELDRPAPYRGVRPIGEGTTDGTPTNPWTRPATPE